MPSKKKCCTCKRRKNVSAFNKNRTRRDGLQHCCRVCQHLFTRAHYLKNKAVIIKNAAVRASEKQRRLAAVVAKKKAVPCADCGGAFPTYVMDFDHVRGVKIADVSRLVRHKNLGKLLEEIEKCDVVCANCHRIRTFKRREERLGG